MLKTLLVNAGFSWGIICPSIPFSSAWEKHKSVSLGGAVQCVVMSLVGWGNTAITCRFCTEALKKGLGLCFLTSAGLECKTKSWFKGCGEQVRAFTGFFMFKRMAWLASFPNTERWIFPLSHLPYWKGKADICNCLYKIQYKNCKSFMLFGIRSALLKPKDSLCECEFKHFHMDTSPSWVRYAHCLHYIRGNGKFFSWTECLPEIWKLRIMVFSNILNVASL